MKNLTASIRKAYCKQFRFNVWRRLDGRLEVISGRHRLDLARRSGEQTIPAQIHNEAEGFDADRAMMLDAELNIRDGQGKVRDYVDYFQGSKITEEDAQSRGLLARATGKRAYAIANRGSESLITAHRASVITDEGAYSIAQAAPNDERLQAVAIRAIQDGKSITNAVNTMLAVKAMAGQRADTTGDMFGFDDSAMREAEEMAKIASSKQRVIAQRVSAIAGAAKNPALAKKEGVDVKDPEAIKHAGSGQVSEVALAAFGKLDEIISSAAFVGSGSDKAGRNTIKEVRLHERVVLLHRKPAKLRVVVRVAHDGSRY